MIQTTLGDYNMSFTYNEDLSDDVSKIRFAIGDTNQELAIFPDETINALINIESTLEGATSKLIQSLYLDFVKRADVAETDDMRFEYGMKAKQYEKLYQEYKSAAKKAAMSKKGFTPMYFGGIKVDEYNKNNQDSTLVKPDFMKNVIYFNRKFPELTPYPEETSLY